MCNEARPVVVLGDGPVPLHTNPRTLAGLLGAEPDVVAGWSPGVQPWLTQWLSEYEETDGPRLRTVMAGYGFAKPINSGAAQYVPLRLSAVDRFVEWLKPDLAVISAVSRGRGYALRGSVGWQPSLMRHARRLVLEIDPDAPDVGLPAITGEIAAARGVSSIVGEFPQPQMDESDRVIGRLAANLIPDDATVQLGIGRIGEAISAAIDKPVGIRSGLVCNGLRALADRGNLRGRAYASYDWGGAATASMVAAGTLALGSIADVNNPGKLAEISRFISFNTALQVGLNGSVNVEVAGGRRVSGIGGHADFCAGAARSLGGISVIALKSLDPKGQSTIVPRVQIVSTPRSDVDVVITEHGVADLRGASDEERSRRLIDVAAPQFRGTLSEFEERN